MSDPTLPVVEIDLGAIRHNLELVKTIMLPGTRVYGVVKGDAYGVGLIEAAGELLAAGVDALAAGGVGEALALRAHFPGAEVLIYGTYLPENIPFLIEKDLWPTLFSQECVENACMLDRDSVVFLEVDCGFGRLGLLPGEVEAACAMLASAPKVHVRGLYTHLGAIDDEGAVAQQMAAFTETAAIAERQLGRPLEKMVASSRVLIDAPDLSMDAINPGRFLYGLLERPWRERVDARLVVQAVRSKLIQVKQVEAKNFFGYGGHATTTGLMRVGVAVIGFAGGLPRTASGMFVLIRGRKAPVIGLASMEHLLIDLGEIEGATTGDEVVVVGRQREAEITSLDFAKSVGLTELEALPRLMRGLPRRYLNSSKGHETCSARSGDLPTGSP